MCNAVFSLEFVLYFEASTNFLYLLKNFYMKINPNYRCTQQQLYALANLGWQNYLDNLADFTNHKAKYTEEFGTNAIAAVLAAKNLPDIQVRGSVPESI